MACFIVPGAEAVVVTAVEKIVKSKGKALEVEKINSDFGEENAVADTAAVPLLRKVKWLSNMLWGGALLLAFEHVWHGEVVPWFPFLTAAENPADRASMLHEMSTIGVTMAVLVTAAWLGMLIVSNAIEKRKPAPEEATK